MAKPTNERPTAYAVEVAENVAKFGDKGIIAFVNTFFKELEKLQPHIKTDMKVE